jgi:signal transduction histidine kinase
MWPDTTYSVKSARGSATGSLPMLRNLEIRYKLFVILALPVILAVVLASVITATSVSDGVRAGRVNEATEFSVELSGLVHELQKERDYAAGFLGGKKESGYGNMAIQQGVVNQAARKVMSDYSRLELDKYGPGLRTQLQKSRDQIQGLPKVREAVTGDSIKTIDDALNRYTAIIATLISADTAITGETTDSDLTRDLNTLLALSRAKETAAQQRSYVYGTLTAEVFGPKDLERFSSLNGSEGTWLSLFNSSATPAQKEAFGQTVTGPDVGRVDELRRNLVAQADKGVVAVAAEDWLFPARARLDMLRQVELRLVSDVLHTSAAGKAASDRRAIVTTLVMLLAVLASAVLSLFTARTMVSTLTRLRNAADEVAKHRLPGIVQRLERAQVIEPADLDPEMAPIAVESSDEIGRLAESFNAVNGVAVRVAAQQAALRRSFRDMFLNMARRNQSLVNRQLELIDELEHGEPDPAALEELFRIDHLATRMRRTAENLIVLSGSNPSRRWKEPVALLDIIRAAIAEIEGYTRVEELPVAHLGIEGSAAGDLVHLLAELLENATMFSPPDTTVYVAGQPIASGYVVEIEDQGVGLTDTRLIEVNERLADPPEIDLSQRLGMFVVGRLASRHGIAVQLRHSWYGGVVALVRLPSEIIVPLPQPFDLQVASGESPPAGGPGRSRSSLALAYPSRPRRQVRQPSETERPSDGDLLKPHIPMRRVSQGAGGVGPAPGSQLGALPGNGPESLRRDSRSGWTGGWGPWDWQ